MLKLSAQETILCKLKIEIVSLRGVSYYSTQKPMVTEIIVTVIYLAILRQ